MGTGRGALMVGGLEIPLDLHLIPTAIKGFGKGSDEPQSATQSSVLGRLARIYPAPALQAFLFSLLLAFLLHGASAVAL